MANVKSLVKKQIRLDVVFSIIWARRRNYLIPVGTTLIAFYLLMCCVPRYYSVKVMLAPEYETPSVGGGLSSLASMPTSIWKASAAPTTPSPRPSTPSS